jgi:hypothetical protein
MPTEIDLHELYIEEAFTYMIKVSWVRPVRGDKEICLIVGSYRQFFIWVTVVCTGKGIHSPNDVAKLGQYSTQHTEVRLHELCGVFIHSLSARHNFATTIDPQNSGVLIVQL